VDCRGNTADLLRLWQHTGGISGRHARHDQRGVRAVTRAGVGLLWLEDFSHVHISSTSRLWERCIPWRSFPPAAVVHHGGSGTLAAGLRAEVPTLILWTLPD
jgi:hypothetical protein